jgi:hypothetical protein
VEFFVANYNTENWRELLLTLDINLKYFWGFDLIYPGRVSSLYDESLINFAKESEIGDFSQELECLNETKLQEFELILGSKLPVEYRDYLKVFGSGKFGSGGIGIDSIDVEVESSIRNSSAILYVCSESFEGAGELTQGIQDLLENSYLFGGGEAMLSFVFDLRSWRDEDESCDIYGIKNSDITCCYKIGRKFSEFVRDACIANTLKNRFPDLVTISEFDEEDQEEEEDIIARRIAYETTTFELSGKAMEDDYSRPD